jgi:hypothetical protein
MAVVLGAGMVLWGGGERGGVGMCEPRDPWRGYGAQRRVLQAVISARSSVRCLVLFGSTGMPGPMVVVKTIFFR